MNSQSCFAHHHIQCWLAASTLHPISDYVGFTMGVAPLVFVALLAAHTTIPHASHSSSPGPTVVHMHTA
jgi:hypothetical protein